ncbi:MAG TPA: cell division protein FtsZ [Candidatus Dormibacteraeota bacterium]|jgi:cell division protein FtsZ
MEPRGRTPTRIKVIGVGGSGGNALNHMRSAGVRGVELIAVNTDVHALDRCDAAVKINVGRALTDGLGAGGDWIKGRDAATESLPQLAEVVRGADLLFIVAGAGGGTGSGASAVIARAARAQSALTVGLVTRPFRWEGRVRNRTAEAGIGALRGQVDALITIPNDLLAQVVDRRTTLEEAFRVADDVLRQGVQAIADLVVDPDTLDVDLADVERLLTDGGECRIGIGFGAGAHRVEDAARQAVTSPLLGAHIDRARGLLVNITAGEDLTRQDFEAAVGIIGAAAPAAALVSGAVTDQRMRGEARVTLVATGQPPWPRVDQEPLGPSGVPARPRPQRGGDGAMAWPEWLADRLAPGW